MEDEYLPAAHEVHGDEPVTSLYVPAGQAEHGLPLKPVYPAMHEHDIMLELPLEELDEGGHATHVDADTAPTAVE